MSRAALLLRLCQSPCALEHVHRRYDAEEPFPAVSDQNKAHPFFVVYEHGRYLHDRGIRRNDGVIGRGLNDYDAIFRELSGVGFDGWISIEDGVNGIDELHESVAFLRAKIAEHWPQSETAYADRDAGQ